MIDARRAFRTTMYIIKVSDFSSNMTLAKFFLLMKFAYFVVDIVLAVV